MMAKLGQTKRAVMIELGLVLILVSYLSRCLKPHLRLF
jgi:hypothetical protein